MGEVIILDTLPTRWLRLCGTVRRYQEHPTAENRKAVEIAEALYVEMANAMKRGGDAA